MATEEQSNDLYVRYLDTEEAYEWENFVDECKRVLKEDPNAKTVTVPAMFLRRVILDIGAQPLMFDAYKRRFNQLCDELGLPEEKKPVSDFDPGPYS